MKRLTVIIFLLIYISAAGPGQWNPNDTTEFRQRNGLPNFFYKVTGNDIVKIGFIGGSITEADGWRPKTVSWLKSYYHIDSLIDYSAAVGGTNSKYGVFRIDRELLSKYDFDLIFIEFAVNDEGVPSSDIERSIEGMVRKIWKKNPHTDICFVYTVSSDALTYIENGKVPPVPATQDAIASYYGIPSVLLGIRVSKLLRSDTVVWHDRLKDTGTSRNPGGQYVFTKDGVHPTDFGHHVYAGVLSESLVKMDTGTVPMIHELKNPIIRDSYENAGMFAVDVLNNHGMQVIDSPGERIYLDEFLTVGTCFLLSDDTASYYSYSFTGKEFGINVIIGPSGGRYILEIDGVKNEFNAFDGYCSYWRKASVFIPLSRNREHVVKIYPSINRLSLREKREILNKASRRQDLDDHPDTYGKNELIFSDVFTAGKAIHH